VTSLHRRRTPSPVPRRAWRALAIALAVAAALSGRAVKAQPVRRALVIGIDTYRWPDERLAAWRPAAEREVAAWRERVGPVLGLAATATDDRRARIENLDGSVNDALAMAAMLRNPKYGFTDVRLLRNEEATRDGILAALDQLVADARPGDVIAFYYAGHGSQRVNSLAEAKLNRLDQTIVPVDANAGQFDIRNTELALRFDRILDAGAELTLIFDSCHSGSITRGETAPVKKRWAAADPRDARDPLRPPPPEDRPKGALLLAAAEDFQSAQETVDRHDQRPHGAFTSALLRVMRQVPAGEPATQLFARVRAILQQDDRPQNPVLRGVTGTPRRPLFGLAGGAAAGGLTVAVQRLEGDTVLLQGGAELGFGVGTELALADSAGRAPARVRIVFAAGMGSSRALPVAGRAGAIRPGDLMAVTRWVEPDRPPLRTWIPTPLAPAALAAAVKAFAPLRTSARVEWVTDPTELPDDARPLYVVRHGASGWQLQPPAGPLVPLAAPTTASVERAIAIAEAADSTRRVAEARALQQAPPPERGMPRLFVLLPPAAPLRAQLQVGRGTRNDAIAVVPQPEAADYLLAGRDSGGVVAYAWIRPNMRQRASVHSSLPVRSDWIGGAGREAADSLETRAVALARLNGWLTIDAPESAPRFPYRLALRNLATGEVKDSGTTRGGERYDIVLRRDPDVDPDDIPSRWVYIFSIDSWGKGTLLWSYTNTIPFDSAGVRRAPVEIRLLPNGELLRGPYIPIGKPYGTDTFILVASAEQLDPTVFALQGARTRAGASGSTLNQLFSGLGGATRGDPPSVPVTWSIQRVPLHSLKPGGP
jgi:hypothetical protein